jgi:type IV pilus assembly protein PilE
MLSFQKSNKSSAKYNHGFTLVEALVVVAIIGFLATVAWHAYNRQVMDTRRKDAVTALTMASNAMQRCKSDFGIFSNCTLFVTPIPHKNGFYTYDNSAAATNVTSPRSLYTITAAMTANPDGYTLTATKNLADDPECTTLTLDNLGTKGYTGTAPSYQRCWGE